MKQNMFKLILLGCLIVSYASAASAAKNENMSKFFEEKITQVQDSLSQPASSSGASVKLTDINVDLVGLVSFGLTDVLKFTLSTEIDFVLVPDET